MAVLFWLNFTVTFSLKTLKKALKNLEIATQAKKIYGEAFVLRAFLKLKKIASVSQIPSRLLWHITTAPIQNSEYLAVNSS
jgi:flagellar biosynthesis protein FlhB